MIFRRRLWNVIKEPEEPDIPDIPFVPEATLQFYNFKIAYVKDPGGMWMGTNMEYITNPDLAKFTNLTYSDGEGGLYEDEYVPNTETEISLWAERSDIFNTSKKLIKNPSVSFDLEYSSAYSFYGWYYFNRDLFGRQAFWKDKTSLSLNAEDIIKDGKFSEEYWYDEKAFAIIAVFTDNTGGTTDPDPDPDPTDTYTLTVKSDNESYGKVWIENDKDCATLTVNPGTPLMIHAESTDTSKATFNCWKLGNTTFSTSADKEVTVNNDVTYTAYFDEVSTPDPTPEQYTVYVNHDSGIKYVTVNGKNYKDGASFRVNNGTSIQYQSEFEDGYEASSGCAGYHTIDKEDYYINAISKKTTTTDPDPGKDTYTLKVSKNEMNGAAGNVWIEDDKSCTELEIAPNTVVNIHAECVNDCEFTGWRINSTTTVDSTDEDYSFTMPENDLHYVGNFWKQGSSGGEDQPLRRYFWLMPIKLEEGSNNWVYGKDVGQVDFANNKNCSAEGAHNGYQDVYTIEYNSDKVDNVQLDVLYQVKDSNYKFSRWEFALFADDTPGLTYDEAYIKIIIPYALDGSALTVSFDSIAKLFAQKTDLSEDTVKSILSKRSNHYIYAVFI